jgi:NADH dehydrogenase/NADH:ubiquinone oxidoreductase subunit G
MGALTLKSFPFELRGWDIEKFESLDPTDSFGSNTKIYISKDQIVLIEPDYNSHNLNNWITDKGRQFFDGVFKSWNSNLKKNKNIKKDFWLDLFSKLTESLYIFDHCNKLLIKKKFFTIVFDNLSMEVLSLLLIISNNFSFIKLKRAEKYNIENSLETEFQLNNVSNMFKLNSSTLCLLISTNTRYEGYYLNINLRQRFLKGNFSCLSVGSLIDLSFPITFLGSNIQIIKSIAEGNNLICQNYKFAKNPLIIYNNELFKRNDGNNILKIIKTFNLLNKSYNLNMLSSSLSENNNHILSKFDELTFKDLNNYSLLYFINVSTNNVTNFKKILELKLLNYEIKQTYSLTNNNLIILDQNYKINNNLNLFNKFIDKNSSKNYYFYIPTSTFYENEETYLNTEGYLKRTIKVLSTKKTKNNWQILKKLIKYLKKNLVSLDKKNNSIIFFNSTKLINFKNFINFQFYAIQNLTNLSFYLSTKTTPLIITSNFNFKKSSNKIQNTKLKYWLDDFFTSGKDEYSQHSLILTNCSKIVRNETTNFF